MRKKVSGVSLRSEKGTQLKNESYYIVFTSNYTQYIYVMSTSMYIISLSLK